MVTSDFNGDPLLIFSLEHARQLRVLFEFFSVEDDENFVPLIEKVDRFLDEVDSGV